MSAALLGLAFKADAPSQSAKLVLLKLVDICDDEGRRIFPSVATIARAALCEPRTVQRILRTFCDVGLLRKVREGGCGPGSTACYELSVERLALLATRGWAAMEPFAKAGEAAREEGGDASRHASDAGNDTMDTPEPCTNKGDIKSPLDGARVTSTPDKGDMMCHPIPQTYTPQDEREGARARDFQDRGKADEAKAAGMGSGGTNGAAALDPDLAALIRLWPTGGIEDIGEMRLAWADLGFGERADALRRAPSALAIARAEKRRHLGKLATWLVNRNFALLPDPEASIPANAPAADGQAMVAVVTWSRDWWAGLIHAAHSGAPVRTAIGMAHSAKSWGWRGAGIAAMRPARMRQHRADSETGRRWIGWIEAKAGVRFDVSNPEKLWLFAPCEDPEGLAEWIAGTGMEAAAS